MGRVGSLGRDLGTQPKSTLLLQGNRVSRVTRQRDPAPQTEPAHIMLLGSLPIFIDMCDLTQQAECWSAEWGVSGSIPDRANAQILKQQERCFPAFYYYYFFFCVLHIAGPPLGSNFWRIMANLSPELKYSVLIERFHMTSRRRYLCSKTMKRRPCWCAKLILLELNSFLM